jgi:hypothetical protein
MENKREWNIMLKKDKKSSKTLRELGVPEALASDLEAALRGLGKTDGERVIGFTFVTPDGARHELRLEERNPSDPARDRAA